MSVFIVANVNANLNLVCVTVLLRLVRTHCHARAATFRVSLPEVNETRWDTRAEYVRNERQSVFKRGIIRDGRVHVKAL